MRPFIMVPARSAHMPRPECYGVMRTHMVQIAPHDDVGSGGGIRYSRPLSLPAHVRPPQHFIRGRSMRIIA